MRLYNTLTKKKEEFVPLNPPKVSMYTCGPTVYDFTHIGHGRKYVGDDVIKRALTYLGYEVKHVQNITDVGHLVSDADEGEDKLEKKAAKTGETVWEVAEKYTLDFTQAMARLNIILPDIQCKATDHIKDQIEMIKILVDKGYAYDTPEAVYFEVGKFAGYGELFGQKLEEKQTAVREEVREGESKKNPADFALWFKRQGRFANHSMHWDSPWGDGFPGWHIECSAMSTKYLGNRIDIHTGGEDHISVHHPNEIAQSEAATGEKPFVKYWVHHAFLLVDGQKMSKSLGNFYRVADIEDRGFEPLALRYFFLGAHYRRQLNFTFDALDASQRALTKLRELLAAYEKEEGEAVNEAEGERLRAAFREALEDDVNTPEALGIVWEVTKAAISPLQKYELIKEFDRVLGLEVEVLANKVDVVPDEVSKLVNRREEMRLRKDYEEADRLRDEIETLGFEVRDTGSGIVVRRKVTRDI